MLKITTFKRCMILTLSFIIMLCGITVTAFTTDVSAASQAAYYVAPTGSDSNAGTIDAPFQTITKARDVVRTINKNMTGDIYVYLRGGDYRITSTITFGPEDSGTNGYRIFYKSYEGETPVLNGATKVTGWTKYNDNIYKATLNRKTKLRYLFVNDKRAQMTKKTVKGQGGYGTYSITKGQASWAWTSGSNSDGVKYSTNDVPAIASNKDDLEIVNGSTWNENIVCTRDVITDGSSRVLLLQQPYGSIAQLPGWGAAFTTTSNHTIYNAFEFLNSPGQFYFNKTTQTLYYYPRSGENMETADVEAPIVEKLIDISGKSNASRVKNITFEGITFENTDWNLVKVGDSYGRTTCQSADAFIAYYNGNWHDTKYTLLDTYPAIISLVSTDGINFTRNIIKHSGSDGITMVNDVINSNLIGNYIYDITASGITVGHPQHVYLGDGGEHQKYAPGIEGICTNNVINNNMLWDCSTAPGFGGCAGITAFFVTKLKVTQNTVHTTGYNGITLGWGWCNFKDSTTCKDNVINNNRIYNALNRLHDSGAIYTIGQMPYTTINENYVKGIPNNSSGPTYGLHNDEGTAYVTENDNVLDIDPGVTYTINCEDYGEKHDLTILRTYATVNKMGKNPPNSTIDPITVVPDNVWPMTQYNICVNSGVQDEYRSIVPGNVIPAQDYVFPASTEAKAGDVIKIRSSGNSSNTVWFAPSGTTSFAQGASMTKAAGTATSIVAPTKVGSYKLFVVDAQGKKLGESACLLRLRGAQIEAENFSSQSGIDTETCSEGGKNVGFIENGDYAVYNNINFNSGVTDFQARVASNGGGGNIEIRLDSITGPLVGTCKVTPNGDWQTWTDAECKITGASGMHNVYLKFTGGSGYLFNLNWFQFLNTTPEPTTIVGDLNGDTEVDATDYALMKMYLLGAITDLPAENDLEAGDLNADKVIDALDFAVFKQYLLGTVNALPYIK
jgi:hypothetical protein